MALPQDVTEAYLAGSSPEIREFWLAVKNRAPAEVQRRVSEFTSSVSGSKCYFRDSEGKLLWETPDPPPPVEKQDQSRVAVLDTKTRQRIDITRKLALSNTEAVVKLAEAITELGERIAQLEDQLEEARTQLDVERRGIKFRGPWQVAIDYESGAIVTYSERAYVASKAIRSGGQPPTRQGSGWLHMFGSTEVPHERP